MSLNLDYRNGNGNSDGKDSHDNLATTGHWASHSMLSMDCDRFVPGLKPRPRLVFKPEKQTVEEFFSGG